MSVKTTFSGLANQLYIRMRKNPDMLYYDFRLLGSMFTPKGIVSLDRAYAELLGAGLVESSVDFMNFFGEPKTLHRLSEKGRQRSAVEL